MIKIIISMLLLLSLNISADEVDNRALDYKKSCKNGTMNACIDLGILYFTGNGVKENHKKAKRLFLKACKKRKSQACAYVGTIYKRGEGGVERNIKKARFFYAQGCKMGLQSSCSQYNLIREKPEVVGSGKNTVNSGYTYTTDIYGG